MRRVTALIASVVLLAGCSSGATPDSGPAATAAEPPAELAVEGYLTMSDDAVDVLGRSADALSVVGVDGVQVQAGGASVSKVPAEAADVVAAAHDAGLEAELLMGNYDVEIGDFNPDRATELLTSEDNRTAVADALVAQVREGDFDGLQLDLESLDPSHTDGLVDLARLVRERLPERASLSMAVMATDTADGYADEGYDVEALVDVVDRFVLMAYDQHGPDFSDPGPIGGSSWVDDVLGAFLDAGAPPNRVDLGVSGYAYHWDDDESTDDYLSLAEARDLAGGAASWDEEQGEWTATLDDGSVLWWSDARTLELRREVAEDAGLRGLALWELTTADPVE